MRSGEQFSFVCDLNTAGRMDRVITMADGAVLEKEKKAENVYFTVVKT